jgi:hypothetical protein
LHPRTRRWGWILAACVGSFVLYAIFAPLFPIDPHLDVATALLAYLVGFGAVSAMTIASGSGVGPQPPRMLAIWIPAAAVLAGLAWAHLPSSAGPLGIAGSAAVILALLASGSVSGGVLGARIAHPGHLSVVAIVSSLADLWSVLAPSGPTAAIVTSAPLLSVLALPFPMLGTSDIEPLLGLGDIVFVALYLTASERFELGKTRTMIALGLAFAVTALAVIVLARAIPALPFLGVAVLLAHREARLPPPSERRTFALGMVALALLVIGVLALRG